MTDQSIRTVIAALAEKAMNGEGEPPILGHEAAEKMELLSTAAAEDVALLGKTVMEVATRIDMECRDLATTMVDHGQFVARHIRSFAALAKQVGLRNRETRQHITGDSATAQIAQLRETQDEQEQIDEGLVKEAAGETGQTAT
jgi:hypothetical protein